MRHDDSLFSLLWQWGVLLLVDSYDHQQNTFLPLSPERAKKLKLSLRESSPHVYFSASAIKQVCELEALAYLSEDNKTKLHAARTLFSASLSNFLLFCEKEKPDIIKELSRKFQTENILELSLWRLLAGLTVTMMEWCEETRWLENQMPENALLESPFLDFSMFSLYQNP